MTMFLPKNYFDDSLDILNEYKNLTNAELKQVLYIEYAQQVFEDFEKLNVDEKVKIVKMVSEDVSDQLVTLYTLN